MNEFAGSRRTITARIKEKFSDKLFILSSPGTADVIFFKEKASKKFKIEDREDIDIETKGVAIAIVKYLNYKWTQKPMIHKLMCLVQNLL